jgi:hypothetical protein
VRPARSRWPEVSPKFDRKWLPTTEGIVLAAIVPMHGDGLAVFEDIGIERAIRAEVFAQGRTRGVLDLRRIRRAAAAHR